eukprot:m.499234 g.499234  ORF g.499234 m.499234 type:complete len:133 (-) comp57318_c1_seq15:307-705(-)
MNRTAIVVALRRARYTSYELLVAAGAHPIPADLDPLDTLRCAVAAGNLDRSMELFQNATSASSATRVHREVLAIAARLGRIEVLRRLLSLAHLDSRPGTESDDDSDDESDSEEPKTVRIFVSFNSVWFTSHS